MCIKLSTVIVLIGGLLSFSQSPAYGQKPLTRPELARVVKDINAVNGVIETETDLVRLRCNRQDYRLKRVNDTVAFFNPQVNQLNEQLKNQQNERLPHLTVFNNARTVILQKIADIKELERRIHLFGKDSEREAELRKDALVKAAQITRNNNVKNNIITNFDIWEARGNNGRILDEAHQRLANGLGLNQIQADALKIETKFNDDLEGITVAIRQLQIELERINQELVEIRTADNKSLADLNTDKSKAEDILIEQRKIQVEKGVILRAFNKRIRILQARIRLLPGVDVKVPVINSDCSLVLKSE